MATDVHSNNLNCASSNHYESQLKAMSMCWQAFDPTATTTSPYPHHYPSTVQSSSNTAAAAANTFQIPLVNADHQQMTQHLRHHHFAASFAQQLSSFSFQAPSSPSTTPSKKKATPIPDDLKDEAYRERRLKNNESARKSREMRRQKEECTQRRCDQLLHENNLLRAELSILRNQVEHFKHVLSMTTTTSTAFNAIPSGTSQLP